MSCNPTAEMKRYLKASVSLGCVVTGEQNVQVHHIWGRCYKNQKVWVGQWAILPLAIRLHDVGSNHSLNVTHHKKAFEEMYGTQSELWEKRNTELFNKFGISAPHDVIESIIGKH